MVLAAAICGLCAIAAPANAQMEQPPSSGDISWESDSPSDHFYSSFEATIWRLRDMRLPVLATSDNQLVGLAPGAMGNPTTSAILGGDSQGTQEHVGSRILAGMWLDPEKSCAFEAEYFFLSQSSRTLLTASPGDAFGTATVFRPFFDVAVGAESSLFIAGPGLAGGINVNLMQRMQGSEANFRCMLGRSPNLHVDLIGGFRYLAIDESLDIGTASVDPLGAIPTFLSAESFSARNRFYGGQFGTDVKVLRGAWSFDLLAKIAFGVMDETVNINGTSAMIDPVTGAVLATGPATLLAQTTNIGRYGKDEFCIVPQIDFTVGYAVSNNLTLTAGYSGLYVSGVTRPGDAIDRNSTVPTIGIPPAAAAQPAFAFRATEFWAQGIRVGLIYRF
jgi:hypothetical protein